MGDITYKVFDDGYDIYLNGELWITQRAPYDKMFVPDGTYEDNAKEQIKQIRKTAKNEGGGPR